MTGTRTAKSYQSLSDLRASEVGKATEANMHGCALKQDSTMLDIFGFARHLLASTSRQGNKKKVCCALSQCLQNLAQRRIASINKTSPGTVSL